MSDNDTQKQGSDGTKNDTQNRCSASKWAALVNDQVIPMPGRHVTESILRNQANVPPDHVIVRDYNDPHDPILKKGEKVDLAKGSVFYSIPKCDAEDSPPACKSKPKLLTVVDDNPEVVVTDQQTGQSLRELHRVPKSDDLFRDYQSPKDERIAPQDKVDLTDGNVFITRAGTGLRIRVNNQMFTEAEGVTATMTGAAIAKLVYPNAPNPRVKETTPGDKAEIPLNQTVSIENCDSFRVFRKGVVAGFQANRLEAELETLRTGGGKVTLVNGDRPVVIYHDVPYFVKGNEGVTDVLVAVPSGYPARMLDNAYLLSDCPILGNAPGATQEQMTANGQSWQKKSVHPHASNGGNPWDQNIHGIHTYYGEILSWLN
ncbi:E2/UBC family protein [Verrucomicrobiales bacterium BCK34]|nr:E2/UBC family protein [Verrucomicrobiales bacterium BCK34]